MAQGFAPLWSRVFDGTNQAPVLSFEATGYHVRVRYYYPAFTRLFAISTDTHPGRVK